MEGTQITAVREMTDDEYDRLYWPVDNMGRARVIELSDGSKLLPSTDPEGNGPGYFMGLPRDTDEIIGATIEQLVPNTDISGTNRHRPAPPEIKLSNGESITPLADPEGNGPGALFQIDADGEKMYQIHVETKQV